MTLQERLSQYIAEELPDSLADGPISPQDSLIERGLLDSVAVLGLIACIEEETGLRIPDQEVQLEQFETIAKMEALVNRLRERARG